MSGPSIVINDVEPAVARTPIRTILARGLRKRCPRCGEGALFRKGLVTNERCSSCDLVFQRNHGDTWMFLLVTDRLTIGAGVAAVYFGFHPTGWLAVSAFFALMAVPIVATMGNRQGLAIAIDYVSRIYLPA